MKQFFYAFSMMLIVLASCTKNEAEPVMTLSEETVNIGAKGETFDLKVVSNVFYTVNFEFSGEEKWVSIEETVEETDAITYKIKVDENTSTEARTAYIKFIGENVAPKKLTVNQEGAEVQTPPEDEKEYAEVGVLAQWDLLSDKTANTETFADSETFPVEGNGGRYADATYGNGKIEFYNCDKSGMSLFDGYTYKFTRGIGGSGDLYAKGAYPGDYWLVTISPDKIIPANSSIRFTFNSKVGKATTDKWILEYSCDGGSYIPMAELKKETETWTKLLSEKDLTEGTTGSAEVEYNFILTATYTKYVREFTVNSDVNELVIRMRPTGCLAKYSQTPTQKIDVLHNSVESRFSSRFDQDENGNKDGAMDEGAPTIVEIISIK